MANLTSEISQMQLSAIANIYMSVHDIDVIHDTFSEISTNEPGLSRLLGENRIDAQKMILKALRNLADGKYWEEISRFADFSTFPERFKNRDTETVEFQDIRGLWCRGRMLVSERTPDGKVWHVLWMVEMIDEEKRKREQLAAANKKLEESNRSLQAETEAAMRIAKLTESMTSLLMNMPALTFSKDTTNGRYLACNRLFADYACRERPEDVVGLTDHEIFDEQTAQHFVEDDIRTMTMEEPYVFFEDVRDAAGERRQFQTTKLRFVDSTGRKCLLGMSVDVTEMITVRRETQETRKAYEEAKTASMTYSRLARSLSADYMFLYYVDPETEEFTEYSTGETSRSLEIAFSGRDFFNLSRKNMERLIYAEDREAMLDAFTRENVMSSIREHGSFGLTYRLMMNGIPTYVHMKALLVEEDDHIIIGISNVDAQIRNQEEADRIREERITYARISALSGDYLVIYTVNPVTDSYAEYSRRTDFKGFGVDENEENFFEQAREDILKVIYLEDLDLFLTAFTKENVMREIEKNGLFVIDYRLMMDGTPTYVSLKAAMVEEKDGPQIIVGITDIDARVKREREYAWHLTEARNKANLDALTGVKNKHAYVDIEAQLNRQIEEGMSVQFALVVFDVNGLKQVNDTQGHQAGDRYIRRACSAICHVFKHSPVFRVGGDEFVAIVQGHDYEELEERLDRFAKMNYEHAQSGDVVIACGMAKYQQDRSVGTVFERADRLMYQNKRMLKGE